MNFCDQLQIKIDQTSPVVVGIDIDLNLINRSWLQQFDSNQFSDRIDYLAFIYDRYAKLIIDAIDGLVPGIKIQMAGFEPLGSKGLKVVEDLIPYARSKNLLIIMDVKRGDIPATARHYSKAYLGENSPLSVEAMTLNPYLGLDSMKPYIEQCKNHAKGVFVCVKTSNLGSVDLQDLMVGSSGPLYLYLAEMLQGYEEALMGERNLSSLGIVVGATFAQEAKMIRSILPRSFFLVPGLGHQGGELKDCCHYFNSQGEGALFNLSRSVIYPEMSDQDSTKLSCDLLKDRIKETLQDYLLRLDQSIS